MFARDVQSEADGAAWLGLEVVLPGSPRRAPLHTQGAARDFLRVMAGASPLLWARIAPDYYGYWYLLARGGARESVHVVPPITAVTARDMVEAPESPGWYAAWARELSIRLAASTRSPLHSGSWLLAPCVAAPPSRALPWRSPSLRWPEVPPAIGLDQTVAQGPHGYTCWDFRHAPPLALRCASSAGDGRVKAWRKRLREGAAAPVLLLWVTGLCRYLVLDGHDRLHAALLEGRPPPLLALLPACARAPEDAPARRRAIAEDIAAQLDAARVSRPRGRPFSVESANRYLIDAFDDRPRMYWRTTAWPLAGGVPGWLTEVREAALRVLPPGIELDREMIAAAED